MKSRFAAERRMNVPAQVAFHCLADYREHHRPGGFLPPAFSAFHVHRGGVGAGTEASWTVDLGRGRTRRMSATISEPEPGRQLVETGDGVVTTFTVTPAGDDGCVVRFETVFDEPGLGGVLLRLAIGRMLGPLYADELARLEAYAHAHGAVAVAA
jgi:polyketide cyclase/dehydrase/lipid transport protein